MKVLSENHEWVGARGECRNCGSVSQLELIDRPGPIQDYVLHSAVAAIDQAWQANCPVCGTPVVYKHGYEEV